MDACRKGFDPATDKLNVKHRDFGIVRIPMVSRRQLCVCLLSGEDGAAHGAGTPPAGAGYHALDWSSVDSVCMRRCCTDSAGPGPVPAPLQVGAGKKNVHFDPHGAHMRALISGCTYVARGNATAPVHTLTVQQLQRDSTSHSASFFCNCLNPLRSGRQRLLRRYGRPRKGWALPGGPLAVLGAPGRGAWHGENHRVFAKFSQKHSQLLPVARRKCATGRAAEACCVSIPTSMHRAVRVACPSRG